MISTHEAVFLGLGKEIISKNTVIELSTGNSDDSIYYLAVVAAVNDSLVDVFIHQGSLLFDKVFIFKNISCFIKTSSGQRFSANIFSPSHLDPRMRRHDMSKNLMHLFRIEILEECFLEE